MKERTLEQLFNIVFLGCITAILLVACTGLQNTPSEEGAARAPSRESATRTSPEPVAASEDVSSSPVILEEAVSQARRQANAGIAANRSGTIELFEIDEVRVGGRTRVAQDPLPVTAQAGEELWIIATPSQPGAAIDVDEDASPGSGAMLASFLPDDDQTEYPSELALPLKHTDVRAQIVGYVGTVDVTQQFENPFDRKIEAVYVFPLPEKSAVSEFVMSIGERRIRAFSGSARRPKPSMPKLARKGTRRAC